MSRKKGFNEELMRFDILEDEVRASSAAPRTLSGPKNGAKSGQSVWRLTGAEEVGWATFNI